MEGQVFKYIYIYIMKHLKIYIKKTRINNRGLKKILFFIFSHLFWSWNSELILWVVKGAEKSV